MTGFSEQELEYQEGVSKAECEEVAARLKDTQTKSDFIELVEAASYFAAEIRNNIVDSASGSVACKDKCHWCCHQAVGLTAPEVINIVEHININFKPKEKSAVISKLKNLDKKTRGVSVAQRAKLNMSCAFLSFGRCSIYSVRPLACRRLTSYSVESCKKKGVVESEKATSIAYNGIMKGLADGLTASLPEHSLEFLDLTAAVSVALDNESACDDWASGVNSFDGCELRAEEN